MEPARTRAPMPFTTRLPLPIWPAAYDAKLAADGREYRGDSGGYGGSRRSGQGCALAAQADAEAAGGQADHHVGTRRRESHRRKPLTGAGTLAAAETRVVAIANDATAARAAANRARPQGRITALRRTRRREGRRRFGTVRMKRSLSFVKRRQKQ